MGKWFWISILTEQKKEKYTHQKLLELYLIDPLEWRRYLHEHIWYFISHTRRNVYGRDYDYIASEAIYLIDQQITKQIKKFHPGINPVKLWRYLIMRLRWHLMNLHSSTVKNQSDSIDEFSIDNYPCTMIWYDDFDDSLESIWLNEIEVKVISMKVRWRWEREIFDLLNINRATLKYHYNNGIEKVKKFYLSQWIWNETNT